MTQRGDAKKEQIRRNNHTGIEWIASREQPYNVPADFSFFRIFSLGSKCPSGRLMSSKDVSNHVIADR
jgi:hypothetical protein